MIFFIVYGIFMIGDSMNSLSYPLCSLILIILVCIIFFSKKRVNNFETKIYKQMVFYNLLECLFAVCGIILINIIGPTTFANFLIKIDYCLMLLWGATFTKYVISISINKERQKKKALSIINIYEIISSIIILLLPVELIFTNSIIDSKGMSTNAVLISAVLYVSLIAILTMKIFKDKNFENNRKKLIPLFSLIAMVIILLIIKTFMSEIIIQNFVFTIVTLVMYFTIENPDLKMIEQLNLAKDQAEKANLAKSDFLSSMSHEIRTPLNAIVGFSQCILEEDTLEAAKEDAKDIVTASQNLLEIVNGILDISKIEADKMEIVEANYSPLESFESLAKLMIPRIGDKPIELKTKFAEDLPATLYGDSGKVKQIITNILTNAVKYTDKGEINFAVNCVNNENECNLVISIEDTGRGIKPDKINKLFTKFDRLEEDRNTTTEGTGLGLAITKRLVEMLGGKIVVQSKYGEGSKFTVYLKQKIISLNQIILNTKIEDVISNEDFSNKKVLIVDDNKINIKVAERLLRDYNLNIESVFSGFECLDKINSGNTYDLILLDDMMPKMNGVETLKNLKMIEGFNTPCVALTANAVSGMKEKYLSNGFDDYLSKPIDKNELKRILDYYLGRQTDSLFGPLPKEIYEFDDNIVEQKNIEEENNEYYHNKDYLINNGIDVDRGLELLEDIELYNDTFENFIIEVVTRIKELEKYQEEKDMANYAILAHATKSDARYLGCSKLADIAYNHELKSKENDYNYIQSNYNELIDEINKVIEIGKKYLNRI